MLQRGQVQLLQVTNKSSEKNKKTQEQIDNENLQQMILEKMSVFEQITPAKDTVSMTDLYAGANEDKLEQKLKKIYGNQELDNKQKIAEMVKLYDE